MAPSQFPARVDTIADFLPQGANGQQQSQFSTNVAAAVIALETAALDGGVIDSGWVSVTNAEMLDIANTPKLIVAGQAGKIIVPQRALLYTDWRAGAYTGLTFLYLVDDPQGQYDQLDRSLMWSVSGADSSHYYRPAGLVIVNTNLPVDTGNDTALLNIQTFSVLPAPYEGSGVYFAGGATPGGGNAANVTKVRLWYSVLDDISGS